jgi:hypothetical protein
MVREVGRNTKNPIFLMGVYDKKARLVGQGMLKRKVKERFSHYNRFVRG